ncbi:MAG: hypothetical protein IH900_03455, partial [Proteobacteria bacterium]|nr:hypothetical protein [Pseudomonadota bacterium]
MIQDTLPDEGPGEDDSLSETIAAALEEDRGEDIIAELGHAESEVPKTPETPETDEKALSDAGSGAETLGDEGDGQTEDIEPSSAESREAADTESERDTETADTHRQVAEVYEAAVAPFQQYLASKGVSPPQAIRILLAAEHQLSTGTPERKAQIFAKLAKDYGIDLDALADLEDAEPANPEMAQIQQRIGGIERAITGERQQVAAQVRQDAEAEVAPFTAEK